MRALYLVLLPAAGLTAAGAAYLVSPAASVAGGAAVSADPTPIEAPVGATAEVGSPLAVRPESPRKAAARPGGERGPAARNEPSKQKAARAVAVPVGSKTTWVDADEVTVGAFEACVAAGACSMDHVTVIPDSTCNYEAKGREAHPMNCVDWFGAEQYCRHAGARICGADEWFAGCRGPSDQDYPYGAAYDPAACNVVASVGPVADHGTVPVGSSADCEGGYPGLHDMVGNVSEWVSDCNGDYCKFYGGAFTTNEPLEDFASCKHFCAGNQKSFRSSTIGIRCCYDAAPVQ